MEWNTNGLLKHQCELQINLNTDKIDVCSISETYFTRESYLNMKGYTAYYALHSNNTARGGSAVITFIIIKEDICHHEEYRQ